VTRKMRPLLLIGVLILAAFALSGCTIPQGTIDINQPVGPWNTFVVFPVARSLIFLNKLIAGTGIPYSYGWAIIVFTLAVKVVTFPLTLKQLQSAKATQDLQPKLQELQAKYGKDRQKLAEEQMKLYKEAGVNPMGGCLPLLVQMPILFGLYQALYVLANPTVGELTGKGFFWIPNLAFPDLQTGMSWMGQSYKEGDWVKLITYISLPLIMIISQLILQKMTQPTAKPAGDKADQTQMMSQMMMFMPIMFGYITLGLPSGLTLYWSISNILSIVQQYFVSGWGGLAAWIPSAKLQPAGGRIEIAPDDDAEIAETAADKPKRRRRRK
jgi:YidC/Oxa1 family membrane protein insertase